MKMYHKIIFIIVLIFSISSCSKDEIEDKPIRQGYTYNENELELFDVVNQYRGSIGLSILSLDDHISYKCGEHNDYMIEKNKMSHDYFQSRADNIIAVCGATEVGELIGYNYSSPTAALNAWRSSSSHDTLVSGTARRVGMSIRKNSAGKRFYTLILIN
jgi:uncharacterized protein YkwD